MASRSQTELQQQSVDLNELLSELANKIDRLKTLYEQYFMGIEKMEPQVARKEVTRVMLTLQQQYIRNTALRFRFNTMLQKWNIYVTYWNRVLREIENGTYLRHLARAKRQAEREGRELPPEMQFNRLRAAADPFSLDQDTKEMRATFLDPATGQTKLAAGASDDELEEVWEREVAPARPKPPPLPPPAPSAAQLRANSVAAPLPKPPPLPPPKIPGMSDGELRALHQRYLDAQKSAGAAAPVKYETLVSSLAKQVPGVLARPGVKGVRFDVTVENGKPVLKAIPQK